MKSKTKKGGKTMPGRRHKTSRGRVTGGRKGGPRGPSGFGANTGKAGRYKKKRAGLRHVKRGLGRE